MQPHHDRLFMSGVYFIAPNVQVQAVLTNIIAAGAVQRKLEFIFKGDLLIGRAGWSIGHRVTDAGPWGWLFRRHEAPGSCVRDSFEGVDALVNVAADFSIRGGNDGGIFFCDKGRGLRGGLDRRGLLAGRGQRRQIRQVPDDKKEKIFHLQ